MCSSDICFSFLLILGINNSEHFPCLNFSKICSFSTSSCLDVYFKNMTDSLLQLIKRLVRYSFDILKSFNGSKFISTKESPKGT